MLTLWSHTSHKFKNMLSIFCPEIWILHLFCFHFEISGIRDKKYQLKNRMFCLDQVCSKQIQINNQGKNTRKTQLYAMPCKTLCLALELKLSARDNYRQAPGKINHQLPLGFQSWYRLTSVCSWCSVYTKFLKTHCLCNLENHNILRRGKYFDKHDISKPERDS